MATRRNNVIKFWKSKQLWLAVVALVQTIVLNYTGVSTEIWVAIDGIIAVLITMLTVDDVARVKAEAQRELANIIAESANRAIGQFELMLTKKE